MVVITGKRIDGTKFSKRYYVKSSSDELDLSDNQLSSIDLRPLEKCTGLRDLDLRNNHLETVDLRPLENCTELELLFLNNNQLSSIDLKPLEKCKFLKILHLGSNQLSSIDLRPLEKCKFLKILHLGSNQLSSIDLRPLEKCKFINELYLNNNQLSSIDLSPLEKCKFLKILHLNNNQLSSIDLSPLKGCSWLGKLYISDNQLSSIDLNPLKGCTKLEKLALGNITSIVFEVEKISKESELPEVLKDFVILSLIDKNQRLPTTLELSQVGFTLKRFKRVISNINTNDTLKKVRKFGYNSIDEVLKSISKGFTTKEEWEQADNLGFGDKDEFQLAQSRNVADKKALIANLSEEYTEKRLVLIEYESEIDQYRESISVEYDSIKIREYKKELKRIESKLLSLIEIDSRITKIRKKALTDLIEEVLTFGQELQERMRTILAWLEMRIPYVEKWDEMLKQINLFRQNIPVNINRIAQLTKLTVPETESYLKDIVKEMPDVGEYLELEQVFIRQYKSAGEINKFIEEMRKKQVEQEKQTEESNLCMYCGSAIGEIRKGMEAVCPKCGKEVETCSICSRKIYKGEEVVREKKCGSLFHRRHILEWLKVKPECPICKERINEKSLEEIN